MSANPATNVESFETAGQNGGRVPPHSIEAEEHLLSCCLLDGSDSIERCLRSNLPPAAFYSPANRLVYEKVCSLFRIDPPVDVAIVAEELKESGQLEKIGGFAFLVQISGRVPTTAQAQYFIDKVHELYRLRELIKVATGTVEDCYNYQGGIEEFSAKVGQSILEWQMSSRNEAVTARGLAAFTVPADDDPSCLLGNRY